MYNTFGKTDTSIDSAICGSAESLYDKHTALLEDLHSSIDALEIKLAGVLGAHKDEVHCAETSLVDPMANRSSLKKWVNDSSSSLKGAIARIAILNNRIDID
jgi:hypothetical protein